MILCRFLHLQRVFGHFFKSSLSCVTTMPCYTVTVSTGSQWFAGTDDYIYITLVGTEGCSERTLLDKALYNDFERGAVSDITLLLSCVTNTLIFIFDEVMDTGCIKIIYVNIKGEDVTTEM